MEGKIIVRPARKEDVSEILELEKVWPEGLRATQEMITSRIEIFPEGILVVISKGKIVGWVASQIVDSKKINFLQNWLSVTDNGTIRKTHQPEGDTLYGVNLTVSPKAPKDTAIALLEKLRDLIKKLNLCQGMLVSRIPKYYKHAAMSVENYVFGKTKTGRPFDPEIAFYQKLGLEVKRIIPNYIKDPASKNFGVLLSWKNSSYRKNRA